MQHQIKKQKIKTVQTQRDKPNFPLYKTVRIIEVGIVLSMPSPLPPPPPIIHQHHHHHYHRYRVVIVIVAVVVIAMVINHTLLDQVLIT